MEPSYTSRATKWRGETTSVTVRLPTPVVEFIDSIPDRTLRNRSEFLQHWASVGMVIMRDPELLDALEWALDREEPPLATILDAPMEAAGNGQITDAVGFDRVTRSTAELNELERLEESQLEELRNRIR